MPNKVLVSYKAKRVYLTLRSFLGIFHLSVKSYLNFLRFAPRFSKWYKGFLIKKNCLFAIVLVSFDICRMQIMGYYHSRRNDFNSWYNQKWLRLWNCWWRGSESTNPRPGFIIASFGTRLQCWPWCACRNWFKEGILFLLLLLLLLLLMRAGTAIALPQLSMGLLLPLLLPTHMLNLTSLPTSTTTNQQLAYQKIFTTIGTVKQGV